PVEGAEGHVGPFGHGPHLHGVVAALGGQRQRGVQDPLAPLALRRGAKLTLAGRPERVDGTCSRWCHADPSPCPSVTRLPSAAAVFMARSLAAQRWNVF